MCENVQTETLQRPLRENTNQDDLIVNDDIDIDEIRHKETLYENTSLKKPIADFAVTNLEETILENSKDEDNGFKKEYKVC